MTSLCSAAVTTISSLHGCFYATHSFDNPNQAYNNFSSPLKFIKNINIWRIATLLQGMAGSLSSLHLFSGFILRMSKAEEFGGATESPTQSPSWKGKLVLSIWSAQWQQIFHSGLSVDRQQWLVSHFPISVLGTDRYFCSCRQLLTQLQSCSYFPFL